VNFLFHMYLSGNDPDLLTGNFMGDFVKGPLDDTYPPRIRRGLLLHRKIDSFAQGNADFQASRLRLSQDFGLYRGVLVDLFYDHFLAREWDTWSNTPFPDYLSWARSVVKERLAIMPRQLRDFVPVIFEELLPSYKDIEGTAAALARMSRRVRRPNPLAEGGKELTRHYEALKTDFERFIIAVQRFSADCIKNGEET
jgi:acyl carrier protein phosphodiesterase